MHARTVHAHTKRTGCRQDSVEEDVEEEQRSGDGRLWDGGNKIRAPLENWEMHCVLYITYSSISIYVPTRYKASRRRGRRRNVIELGGEVSNEEAKELRRDSK